MDGVNLRQALVEGATERKAAIGFRYLKKTSWVTDRYKLITLDEGMHFEMYDLINDPLRKERYYQSTPNVL